MVQSKLNILGSFIVSQFQEELREQGHDNTGKLIDSLRPEVVNLGDAWEVRIVGLDYAKFVNYGIKPGKKLNPFALAKWVEQKGIASGEKEIKSIAFAIRQKIFQEGMPTENSLKFSKTGSRTDFISITINKNSKFIFSEILNIFKDDTTEKLNEFIKQENSK